MCYFSSHGGRRRRREVQEELQRKSVQQEVFLANTNSHQLRSDSSEVQEHEGKTK